MSSSLKWIPKSIAKLHKNIMPLYGYGPFIYTKEQKMYLDFTSGIGALSTGHQHPYIVEKVKNQLNKIIHVPQQVFGTHEPQVELTEKLMDIMPSNNLNSVFYTTSGSEATDNAIKIARRHTGKTNIIAMLGGFHGRTIGALSVTSSNNVCKFRSQPLIPGVFFCETPTKESIDKLFEFNTSPDETAGIIIEPVQGEGGVKNIPTDFMQYVQRIANKNNIMLIADEVQCGAGRTGTWWNVEQKGVVPDIMTFGKGIASGYPLAGLVMNNELSDNLEKGYLGGTYGGNALVSVAASATIDVIRYENILDNVNICGKLLAEGLEKFEQIKEVRQYGLMIAIEFHPGDEINTIDVVERLRDEYHTLVLLAGNRNQYIRLLPPLNITEGDVDVFLENMRKALN